MRRLARWELLVRCPLWKDCDRLTTCPHRPPHVMTGSCEHACTLTEEDTVCTAHGGSYATSRDSEDERSREYHEGWVKGFNAGKKHAH